MDLGATICTRRSRLASSARGAIPAWRARAAIRRRSRKGAKKTGALRRGAAFVVLRADGFHPAAHARRKRSAGRHDRSADTEWSAQFDASTHATRRRFGKRSGAISQVMSTTSSRIFRCD